MDVSHKYAQTMEVVAVRRCVRDLALVEVTQSAGGSYYVWGVDRGIVSRDCLKADSVWPSIVAFVEGLTGVLLSNVESQYSFPLKLNLFAPCDERNFDDLGGAAAGDG